MWHVIRNKFILILMETKKNLLDETSLRILDNENVEDDNEKVLFWT